MPSKQSKKVYRIITLLTLLAFIFMNAGYASIGSGALRPPMNFAKIQKDKRVTSKDTNPFLYLLRKQGKQGNITIDDKTTVISMGGGDGYGLNDLIANIAEKTHAEDGRVIVVLHGLKGLLSDKWQDNLFEITPEIAKRLRGLPSIASGSCREKVDPKKPEGLEKIEKIIKRTQNAKKIVFIGGNDHLRLTKIIADKIKELKSQGQDIKTKIIGVSKSIDNDFGNTMLCHCTAFMAGRKIVKRASVLDNGNKIMVFESFGRYMGGLNLEMSKACPYSKAVLSPERKVTIQNIVDAWV